MIDPVIRDLNAKIERCEAVMSRTRLIWEKPQEAPGWAVTGGSNRPASLDRAVDRENNRKSNAFKLYQEAEQKLRFFQARLKAYQAGEVHANGQPRADAPSRKRREDFREKRGEWYRSIIKPGDKVVVAGTENTIDVKRVNKKTITAESGSKWDFDEIYPLIDGQIPTPAVLAKAMQAWMEAQKPTT